MSGVCDEEMRIRSFEGQSYNLIALTYIQGYVWAKQQTVFYPHKILSLFPLIISKWRDKRGAPMRRQAHVVFNRKSTELKPSKPLTVTRSKVTNLG